MGRVVVPPGSLASWLAGAALVSLLVACGGGLPALEPARTLNPGEVRAVGGFSGHFALGNVAAVQRAAVNETAGATSAPAPGDQVYAQGALVSAAVGPGIAPVAGANVGIPGQFEAGIMYTGRDLHLELRRSFSLSATWDLSVGVGGTAVLYGEGGAQTSVPGVDLGHMHGWGGDVPVLVGYQSDGDLYMIWLGVRGGVEGVSIGNVTSEPGTADFGPTPMTLSATELYAGALLGAAVGFRHLHVAMELDASYVNVTGDFNATHANVAGATITPAAALWWTF
jgi:hypothetical protein